MVMTMINNRTLAISMISNNIIGNNAMVTTMIKQSYLQWYDNDLMMNNDLTMMNM